MSEQNANPVASEATIKNGVFHDGPVTYSYNKFGKKWEFNMGNGHTIFIGGRIAKKVHAVARQINGGLKRVGFLDALARGNISKLVGTKI